MVEKKLELEEHNFRVDSTDWEKITMGGEDYRVNPEGDVWEIVGGDYKGEQLFTWHAAMRETKKAGKRMPTDEEFTKILKTKADMPNPVFLGSRFTGGPFGSQGTYAYFWSSVECGPYAWSWYLNSGYAAVYRNTSNKASGFSVRCLKD